MLAYPFDALENSFESVSHLRELTSFLLTKPLHDPLKELFIGKNGVLSVSYKKSASGYEPLEIALSAGENFRENHQLVFKEMLAKEVVLDAIVVLFILSDEKLTFTLLELDQNEHGLITQKLSGFVSSDLSKEPKLIRSSFFQPHIRRLDS